MRHFSTACDRNYLDRLQVLFASMQRHCRPFVFHVLAWDAEVAWWCASQGASELERDDLADFLRRHPELALGQLPGAPRNVVEHNLTCRTRWAADVMRARGVPVTHLDVDLMFWSSPEPVFEEIGPAPAAVLPHAFAPVGADLPGVTMESHRRYGLFNGGFVHLADIAFADAWADACRGWCSFDVHEAAPDVWRFTDQGYLDDWPARGARIIRHPGVCPGPWNVHTQRLARAEVGALTFGGVPLVAYHYSSLKVGGQLANPEYEITARQAELLYLPYLAQLERRPHAESRG